MADATNILSAEDFASIRARAAHRPQPPQELAAVEFEAIGPEIAEAFRQAFSNPGWNKECRDLGIVLRMATAIVQKTKPELIAIVETLVDGRHPEAADGFFELVTCYREFQRRLELWRRLLEAAEARQLIAAEALSPDDGGGGERLPKAA